MKRSEVEILDEELLPENYRGTERQNRYYSAVLSEIARIAEHNGRAIEQVIGEYIIDGIMSKRFAENPELNWRCTTYRYEAPASKYYDDFIKIPAWIGEGLKISLSPSSSWNDRTSCSYRHPGS